MPLGTRIRAGGLLLTLKHGRKPWRSIGGARFSHAQVDEALAAGVAVVAEQES
jgi:hypothetical protein